MMALSFDVGDGIYPIYACKSLVIAISDIVNKNGARIFVGVSKSNID